MIKHLFLYGTLINPDPDEAVAQVVNRLHRVGTASVRGRLYDFGDYPGAVVDPSSNSSVRGELVELPKNESVLPELDSYEEFDSDKPHLSLFVRTRVKTQLSDGRRVEAGMYVYNRNPGDASLVVDGTYSKSKVA